MKSESKQIRLGDIIIDPLYQVRKRLPSEKIGEYARAMERGDVFPAIVIEAKTNKVVSGFTRVAAYQRAFEPDHEVDCAMVEFKNDNERYTFALADNMRHGVPLQVWDKQNAIFEMRRRGFGNEAIAKAINWPIYKVTDVAGVKVRTIGKKAKKQRKDAAEGEVLEHKPAKTVDENGNEKALKGGLEHLRGATINEEVYANIEQHYVGWPTTFIARQLIMRIDDNTLNLTDADECRVLGELADKLSGLNLRVPA